MPEKIVRCRLQPMSLIEKERFEIKDKEPEEIKVPTPMECFPLWMSRWAQRKGTRLLQGIQTEMLREQKKVTGKAVFSISLHPDGRVAIRLMSHSDSLKEHAALVAERFEYRARATLIDWPTPKEPVIFEAIFLL